MTLILIFNCTNNNNINHSKEYLPLISENETGTKYYNIYIENKITDMIASENIRMQNRHIIQYDFFYGDIGNSYYKIYTNNYIYTVTNLYNKKINYQNIEIPKEIKINYSWATAQYKKTIIGFINVQTKYKKYKNCLVIKIELQNNKSEYYLVYYVKKIGLIKKETYVNKKLTDYMVLKEFIINEK